MPRYEPKSFKEAMTTWLICMFVASPFLWIVIRVASHIADDRHQQDRAYYAPAIIDFQNADYTDSEKLLDIYLTHYNENYYAHYLQGLCQFHLGESSQAETQFQAVVNYSLENSSGSSSRIDEDNDHLLHDDAQQMMVWMQDNPGNTSPPANLENIPLLQSIEHLK